MTIIPILYTLFELESPHGPPIRTPVITGTLKQLGDWCERQGYDWAEPHQIHVPGGKRYEVKEVYSNPDGSMGVKFYDPTEFVFIQFGGWS